MVLEPQPAEPQPAEPQPTPTIVSPWAKPLSVQACPYAAPTMPDQAETALDATLLVRTSRGIGSAMFISPDGFALTAAHVVGAIESVSVVSHGGHALQAKVVRVHEGQDVALLKVEVSGASPCFMPLEERAPVGSDVFILGSPAGEELSFSVSKGIVSGYRELDDAQFVQLDASVNPGNSGGPALTPAGRLVGIASWKVSHVSMEGLAFAVPIAVAMQALGVTLGAASSSDWAALGGRHGTEPAQSEPPTTPNAAPSIDPALLRRRRVRRGLIVWGATTAGAGITAIVTTAAVFYSQEQLTSTSWKALLVTNTLGWALTGTGSAMLLAGLLVRTKPRAKRPTAHLLPTGRGLLLHGTF